MKDTCVVRADQAGCVQPLSAGKGPMSESARNASCPDGDSTSLATLLPQLKTLDEEQAWAVGFLTCVCLSERSTPVDFELTLENVRVRPQGTVVITEVERPPQHENSPMGVRDDDASEEDSPLREEEVVSSLGMLIYDALDYGLHEDDERELAPETQELIERLTTEVDDDDDDEETPPSAIVSKEDASPYVWSPGPVTARELVKVCEFRACSKDQSALTHYQDVCRAMVHEADIMCLYRDKSGALMEGLDYLQDAAPHVRSWRSIVQELKAGVKLKPAKQGKSYSCLQSLVVDELRQGGFRKTLRHVEPQKRKPPRNGFLLEIKKGLDLKPVSKRVLSEKVENKTQLEQLMEDIGTHTAVKLRAVPDTEKRYHDKPAPDSTTVLFRALRRAEIERQQDFGATMINNDRNHARAPGMRTRSFGMGRRKHTPNKKNWRLGLETVQNQTSSSPLINNPQSALNVPRVDSEECFRTRAYTVATSFNDFKGFSSPVQPGSIPSACALLTNTPEQYSPLAEVRPQSPELAQPPVQHCQSLDDLESPPMELASSPEEHRPSLSDLRQSVEQFKASAAEHKPNQCDPDTISLFAAEASNPFAARHSTEEDSKSLFAYSPPVSRRVFSAPHSDQRFSMTLNEFSSSGLDEKLSSLRTQGRFWPQRASEAGLNSINSQRPPLRRRVSSKESSLTAVQRRHSLRRSSRLHHSPSGYNLDKAARADNTGGHCGQSPSASPGSPPIMPLDYQPLNLHSTDDEITEPAPTSVTSSPISNMRMGSNHQFDRVYQPNRQFLDLPMGSANALTQGGVMPSESVALSVDDDGPLRRVREELSGDELPSEPSSSSSSRARGRAATSAMPLLMTGGLSYAQIVAIRTKQTNSELALMEDASLRMKLQNAKVCFACRKKKFSFFSFIGGRNCILCQRKVCPDCITKMVLLDVDFSNSTVPDLESLAPIEACYGCRVSLIKVNHKCSTDRRDSLV